MSMELIHTSVPRGLRPGTSGFCTVAATQGMPAPLMDRLEAMSGLKQELGAAAGPRPIARSHVILAGSGTTLHVLSRIAPAPADYSGRTNRIAHHLVLAPAECPTAGPAAVLGAEGVFRTEWSGDPCAITRQPILQPDVPVARPCEAWKALCGDAGWAGRVIENLLHRSADPLYLLVPPSADPLALMGEVIALLPEQRRWDATFTTLYQGGAAPDARCCIRFLPRTAEALRLVRSTFGCTYLDLTQLGNTPAPTGAAAEAARIGAPILAAPPTAPKRAPVPTPASRPEVTAPDAALPPPEVEDLGFPGIEWPEPRFTTGARWPEHPRHKPRNLAWLIASIATAAAAVLVLGILLYLYLPWGKSKADTDAGNTSGPVATDSSKDQNKPEDSTLTHQPPPTPADKTSEQSGASPSDQVPASASGQAEASASGQPETPPPGIDREGQLKEANKKIYDLQEENADLLERVKHLESTLSESGDGGAQDGTEAAGGSGEDHQEDLRMALKAAETKIADLESRINKLLPASPRFSEEPSKSADLLAPNSFDLTQVVKISPPPEGTELNLGPFVLSGVISFARHEDDKDTQIKVEGSEDPDGTPCITVSRTEAAISKDTPIGRFILVAPTDVAAAKLMWIQDWAKETPKPKPLNDFTVILMNEKRQTVLIRYSVPKSAPEKSAPKKEDKKED